ncbi:MAG: SUMF1/EgtB/PvdO family nonheme iron enzyme [Desulfobacula sp.]|nr:SUMF1/EgtB/PvdO family nonheme iron enzyme [Desulfobacula sp.]
MILVKLQFSYLKGEKDTRNKISALVTIICVILSSGFGNSAQTAPALPSSIVFKDIAGGIFTMGGTTVNNDAPMVNVTVSAFKMSEKEITNSEYIAFLNAALADGWVTVAAQQTADPCGVYTENMVIGAGNAPNSGQIFLQLGETGGCTSSGEEEHIDNKSWLSFNSTGNTFELLDADKADWPVNWVKWYGAYAFTQYYDVSLPSEAQWEYAARGGQQFEYPTDDGTLSSTKANYNGDIPGVHNATGHSMATGSYASNPYGLYDMGGNVWEWCLDYYDAGFYTDGAIDPLNATAGTDSKRVRRGGSWNYHAATLLTYARASDGENKGNNHFGFRIVKIAGNDGTSASLITIKSDLSFQLPDTIYKSLTGDISLWIDFKFFGDQGGKLLWELTDYGNTTSAGNSITIASDLSFSIPNAKYQSITGDINLETNFKFFGDQSGKLLWELDSYTVK